MKEISNNKTLAVNTAPPGLSGKELFALAAILVLSSILISLQRFMDPEMGRDSSYYLVLAEYWRDGGFQGVLDQIKNFWFPPLHLFLIAALSHTGLSPETAAMIIGMGCGIT